MQKTCANGWCQQHFTVTEDDLLFYEKVSPVFNGKRYDIPPPTLCPDCRRQRRCAFRNERHLYRRTCDASGRTMLSIYAPEKPVAVIRHEKWWQDDWDQLATGREISFVEPFFEQIAAVWRVAPRPSIHVISNENCEYVNQCGYSKNCYLSYNTDWCEDCYYCTNVIRSQNCTDLLQCEHCELCSQSTDLKHCTRVHWSLNCQNCHDVLFSRDLRSCSDCFGCIGLRHKQYCFFNEQLSKEAYRETLDTFDLGSRDHVAMAQQKAAAFFLQKPHRALEMEQCEDSLGNYLVQCKKTRECYDSFNNDDIAYCTVTSACKDSRDYDIGGYECELCLEMISSGYRGYITAFGSNHWNTNRNMYYCELMANCSNCFGCIGLHNQQYCILNTQYSREEYERLVPRIIEHMREHREWGEFFPISMSVFGYNESVAQEYFPLSKTDANTRDWPWFDQPSLAPETRDTIVPPDRIKETTDAVCSQTLTCIVTGKPFKIIPQELAFARSLGLPLPAMCPEQRHAERMALRSPRHLWQRTCDRCNASIQTTYAPDRPEKIYCETCFQKEVY